MMKKLSMLTFSAIATSLLLTTGCKETEKKEVTTTETEITKIEQPMGPVDIQMSAVPEPVQTSFKTRSAKKYILTLNGTNYESISDTFFNVIF